MKTLSLQCPQDEQDLVRINKLISKSKKIATLTGAGISCNAGIPDFRSTEGLYNMVKKRHPDSVVKGKDLFDISLFRDEKTLLVFCTFMESLYSNIINAKPTETHNFISKLLEKNKLIKCYTQNIDGLERHLGLQTGINEDWKSLDVVQLHGDLNSLHCTSCFQVIPWTLEYRQLYQEGELPECPQCTENFFNRMSDGKRMSSSTVGLLKPNIILYGENHPYLEKILKGLSQDMNKNPQLLIILGTSLKVDGVKRLVREYAKRVHQRDGLVIFINNKPVGSSAWDKIIDYHIEADCDDWCRYLQEKLPTLFTKLLTPPTTPSKQKLTQDLSLKDCKNHLKFDYITPEYSPKKSPRRNLMTKRTMSDITNITNLELESPTYSPIKKIHLSPTLTRTYDVTDKRKRKCIRS